MFKKSALIIDNKKDFSKYQIFKFYCLKRYDIDIKEHIIENTHFYKISIPVPKKIKEKNIKYLAQYINKTTDKTSSGAVYYCWEGNNKEILYRYFNNDKNNLSCASYYPADFILKRYASFFNISMALANIILICDFPIEAEKIIRQICRDVRAIHIYTKNTELYKPLTDYFLSEYGILLTVGETLECIPKKNRLAVNLSNDAAYVEKFILKNEIKVLNLADKNLNIKNVYENIIFSANNVLKNIILWCGVFNKNVLNFMFKAISNEKNKAEFMRFIHKFDIKIMKFVKND